MSAALIWRCFSAVGLLLGWGLMQAGSVSGLLHAQSASQSASQSARQDAEEDAPEFLAITFDNIKLDMEADDEYDESFLTDEVKELDGKKVQLRGFILPSSKQKGLRAFVLVRDNQECCFGPGAALFDSTIVKLKKGSEAEFTTRPVTVQGKFQLKVYRPRKGMRPLGIYLISDAELVR